MQRVDTPLEVRTLSCSSLEYILLGDLRTQLEDPRDPVEQRWLQTTLDALLALFAAETADGSADDPADEYLAGVLERFPNWHDQVQALLAERTELFQKLRALRIRLSDGSPVDAMAAFVRNSVRDWMTRFITHRRLEHRLVLSAYTTEVGGNG